MCLPVQEGVSDPSSVTENSALCESASCWRCWEAPGPCEPGAGSVGWAGGCLPGCPSVDCPAEASSQLSSGSACSASGGPQVSLVESPSPRTRVWPAPGPQPTAHAGPPSPASRPVAGVRSPPPLGSPCHAGACPHHWWGSYTLCTGAGLPAESLCQPSPAQGCDQTAGSQTVHTLPVGSLVLPVPKPHGGVVPLKMTRDPQRMEQMNSENGTFQTVVKAGSLLGRGVPQGLGGWDSRFLGKPAETEEKV